VIATYFGSLYTSLSYAGPHAPILVPGLVVLFGTVAISVREVLRASTRPRAFKGLSLLVWPLTINLFIIVVLRILHL
jgi:hypothetical protein